VPQPSSSYKPPPLVAQQTYVVDATGIAAIPVGATRTSSLTAAANAAVAGDTILIHGLVDPLTGQILGYSEQAWYPYQQTNGAESFPILLKAGVTVKPANSTQVYVWSTVAAPALIELLPPTVAPSLTKIESLTLIGGLIGVKVRQTTGSASQTLLKNLVLDRQQIGAVFAAEGTVVGASVRECVIADFTITTPMTAPQYQAQSVGLKFEARDGGSPAGNLQAEIIELTTIGAFANMAPLTWNTTIDLERDHGIQAATRLIEVDVHGNIREHPSAPTSFVTSDISDVDLVIQGGVLDGKETSSSGWDVALYTSASTLMTTGDWDYYAGYRVALIGTEVRNCRLAGILGSTTVSTRGRIETTAQTLIHDIGSSSSHSAGDYRHSGVHLFGIEGYLAFIGKNSSSRDNTGNGIWAHHYAEIQGIPYFLPQGVFMGLFRFESHLNDGNGVEFRVGDLDSTGIVGGTAHYVVDESIGTHRNLSDDGEPFQVNVGVSGTADLEFGQGQMDRCAISNNGEGGIYVRSHGTHSDTFPDRASATINCRLSNSFVWNNPRGAGSTNDGGLFVQLEQALGGEPDDLRGLCLLPVTHCTFANNGGSASWNVEFEDGSDSSANAFYGRYAWSQLQDPYMATALYDSIFFRDIPSYFLNDFGTNLEFDIGDHDAFPGGLVASWIVGVAGVRAKSFIWFGDSVSNNSTPTPFVGFNPTSLSPSWMFLNSAAINIGLFRDNTAIYLPYNASETNKDYSGDARPSIVSGLRDKGGEDL